MAVARNVGLLDTGTLSRRVLAIAAVADAVAGPSTVIPVHTAMLQDVPLLSTAGDGAPLCFEQLLFLYPYPKSATGLEQSKNTLSDPEVRSLVRERWSLPASNVGPVFRIEAEGSKIHLYSASDAPGSSASLDIEELI